MNSCNSDWGIRSGDWGCLVVRILFSVSGYDFVLVCVCKLGGSKVGEDECTFCGGGW